MASKRLRRRRRHLTVVTDVEPTDARPHRDIWIDQYVVDYRCELSTPERLLVVLVEAALRSLQIDTPTQADEAAVTELVGKWIEAARKELK